MNKWLCSIAGLTLALAGSLAAQAQTSAVPPPNILNIQTDSIKPYEDGSYDKVASEYPALAKLVEDTTHVVGMEALTGPPRALYLTGYDSYAALQKNEESLMGDTATNAKFDALDARLAPHLAQVQNAIWHYRPDLSNNVSAADIPHSHYWEVVIFHMRSGQNAQFEKMTKLYRDANVKIGQNIPWATYEGQMGVTDAFLVLVPMTSLKDEDTGLAHEKEFGAALGDDGKLQMDKLSADGVTNVEDNIWMVIPEWSYVDKSWIDADPQFWGAGPTGKPAAKHVAGSGLASKVPLTH